MREEAHNHTEAIVRVHGLSKTYGWVHALEDVGFSIRAGEILGLIGPNGAGKTTLFECVAGLEPADSGEIFFGPLRVEGRHRSSKLFYVPDGIAPWPDQPVRWVLEYSLGFFGGPPPRRPPTDRPSCLCPPSAPAHPPPFPRPPQNPPPAP